MVGVHCSNALKIYPSFQQYDDNVGFASFICTDDNDNYISGDEIEWLYLPTSTDDNDDYILSGDDVEGPYLTRLTSTPDYRIFGINIFNCLYIYYYTFLLGLLAHVANSINGSIIFSISARVQRVH